MASRAYFDDSGTHPGSELLVWAGFVGTAVQWDHSEPAWIDVLASRGLTDFHMWACAGNDIEGLYGNHAERASLIHDLRKVILDADLFGIAIGIDMIAWRELMADDPAAHLLTSDNIAVSMCAVMAGKYAIEKDVEPKNLAHFFDRGAAGSAAAVAMVKEINAMSGRADTAALIPVKSSPALQMADMLAWEARRDGIAYVKDGAARTVRAHFQRFLDKNNLIGGLIGREEIQRLKHRDPTMGDFDEIFRILGATAPPSA